MNTDQINQLTSMSLAEAGSMTLADGRVVTFIALHLSYLRAGKTHKAPVLTMTPDQARAVAMQLLAAADKAPGQGSPDRPTLN